MPVDAEHSPVALSVAGSDSGGGAGIQADLRAFAFFRVFGTTAITAVTAQNPEGVTGVEGLSGKMVSRQIDAVLSTMNVGAVKTGMLFSEEIIRAVADVFAEQALPLVVDPVMVATSGARLLQNDAVSAMQQCLLPLATVITPNIPEAEVLCGRALDTRGDRLGAARDLARRFGCTVVLKGGHSSDRLAVDFVSDATNAWELASPRIDAASTHGTGCSFSSAVAACLACGDGLDTALKRSKAYVYGSLASCRKIGPRTFAMASPAVLPVDAVEFTEVSL